MPSTRPKVDVPFTSEADVVRLVQLFESCDLPYERWTHRAHLAVAAVYLRRYPLPEATDRARTHIPLYNRTRGNPNGYHETITVLFMRLVDRELRAAPAADLPALVNDLAGRYRVDWLYGYYTPDRLWSAEAHAGFIDPDVRPLDF